ILEANDGLHCAGRNRPVGHHSLLTILRFWLIRASAGDSNHRIQWDPTPRDARNVHGMMLFVVQSGAECRRGPSGEPSRLRKRTEGESAKVRDRAQGQWLE